MKKTRVFALLLALVMIVASLPLSAFAASKTMYVKTRGSKLYVRSTASIQKNNIITKLSNGTVVTLISKSGSWSLITWGNNSKNKGYVASKYLSSTSGKSTNTDTDLGYAYVKTVQGIGANLRVGKRGTAILRVVPDGKRVKILAKSSGGWTKVSYGGTVGYIYSSLLRTTK